jgi:hypothetical protein
VEYQQHNSTTAHGSLTAVEQLSNMSSTGEPVALSDPDTVGQFAAQAAHLLQCGSRFVEALRRSRLTPDRPEPCSRNLSPRDPFRLDVLSRAELDNGVDRIEPVAVVERSRGADRVT